MEQVKMVSCPYCRKKIPYSVENKFRPFCSERCSLLDLGQWADEAFKIPALEREAPPVNENPQTKNEED